MATVAELKRKLGRVGAKARGGYFWKVGTPSDLKEWLDAQSWRTVEKAQSNGVKLSGSWLDYPRANNSEFDGRILKIYETGWRALTAEEKAVLAEWEEIASDEEFKKRAEIDALTDGSSTYWQEREFYERKNMLYLFTSTATKSLDRWKLRQGEEFCVKDNSAPKGKLIAIYEIAE